MKLHMIGRLGVAALAGASVLALAGCGSDDKPATKAKTTTTTKATAAANTPPVPTVAELNQELTDTLNPAVPDAQKVANFEDGEAALAKDPEMISKLVTAYQQNNVTIQVTDVTSLGDALSASANVSINGGAPSVVTVPFVAQDGKWKLQKAWACAGLQNLGQASPACD
ncbi:hypothetical protein JK358_13310 [Nocardia sp. 2]|uniref:Low molecular weight antigen MTB12-like C-terminal domain-containing protein n=1 Tax=Nocardia acididurans TaxID=2802282 RepID=A0ABS1M3Y9_9NOCA|nr:hypothetical protein [Nocardia acididurans]MBL1075373.1 hypothetical protein [Nocardia acididurans]